MVKYRDAQGNKHVDHVKSVTGEKSAQEYVKNKGCSETQYVGKEGTVDNAYMNEGDKRTGYYLNADGTATKAADGKPSITIPDVANTEPTIDVAGAVSNGLAAADAAPSTVAMGVELIKKTSTSPVTEDILKVGKVASKVSPGLGIASMGITVVDG